MKQNLLTRREVLGRLSGSAVSGLLLGAKAGFAQAPAKIPAVAAVVTVYRKHSHADVIVGKLLEGWKQDGGPGPALHLASLYVDQSPRNDMARDLSQKHGVPIFDSIEKALTLGNSKLAVDGVLSIGEHGDYPWNEKGQHLYPRKRFFAEIAQTFEKSDRVVPVFNDKHLGPPWDDAQWIYDRATELQIPMMAGSSLPLSFRKPDIEIPRNANMRAVVGIGYGGLDSYGFHSLEFLQTLVERRRNAESGIKWAQCVQGAEMWRALDDGRIRKDLFEAAQQIVLKQDRKDPRELSGKDVALFLFEYNDGLSGGIFMLSGFARGHAVAIDVEGHSNPIAIGVEERREPYFPHFAYLLKAIERMVHTGVPTYPVERTLLTTGLLDRLHVSRIENNRQVMTPELAIRYEPASYPHAPQPELTSPPT